jgi:hypothetical protein
MSLKTKFAAVAVATLALAGTLVTSSEVQARPRWGALGLGIGAGVLLGAAAAHAYPVYGYQRCRFVRQFDAYGYYVGTVRVCDVY